MIIKSSNTIKTTLLLFLSIVGIFSLFFFPPIPQNPTYHQFADNRTFFNIPNFWNVISNLPFVLIGVYALIYLKRKKTDGMFSELFINKIIFFIGIFFTGIGSAYYHFNPSNETLLWDRLPMTISFMAFFSIIIGEFISIKTGKILLFPLLIIGLISVVYWHITEKEGHGDLRSYALVQFLPMILIPLIVLMFPSKFNTNSFIWLMLSAYLLSKIFEFYDHPVFALGNFISGHTIKHISASLAPLIFMRGLYKRKLKL